MKKYIMTSSVTRIKYVTDRAFSMKVGSHTPFVLVLIYAQ